MKGRLAGGEGRRVGEERREEGGGGVELGRNKTLGPNRARPLGPLETPR